MTYKAKITIKLERGSEPEINYNLAKKQLRDISNGIIKELQKRLQPVRNLVSVSLEEEEY
jgi:hypothetical protein